jgi:hypothetical protein
MMMVMMMMMLSRIWLTSLSEAMKVELVSISLSMDLGHNVLVIVISQGSREFVVVHVWFALSLSPSSCYFVRICQLELPIRSFPSNARGIP